MLESGDPALIALPMAPTLPARMRNVDLHD
jgi:hypothetical protein